MELATPPNPCYDPKTKTGCAKRCENCAATCPEWKAYTKARDEIYKKREIERRSIDMIQASESKRKCRYYRNSIHNRNGKLYIASS